MIDYDYIMKLIAKYSGQDPKKLTISREQLIGLIQSDAKFLDEREDIGEYIRSLTTNQALDEKEIRAGYERFKAEKKIREGLYKCAECRENFTVTVGTVTLSCDAPPTTQTAVRRLSR